MTKKMNSIDLVGRAAAQLDLNVNRVAPDSPAEAPPIIRDPMPATPADEKLAAPVEPVVVQAAATAPPVIDLAAAMAVNERTAPTSDAAAQSNTSAAAIGLEWERLYQE